MAIDAKLQERLEALWLLDLFEVCDFALLMLYEDLEDDDMPQIADTVGAASSKLEAAKKQLQKMHPGIG